MAPSAGQGGGSSGTNATITFSGTGTSDFSGTLEDHPNSGTGIRNLAMTGSGTQVFSGNLQTEGITDISNGVFAIDGTHTNAGQYNVTGGMLAGSGTIDTSGGGNTQNDNIILSGAIGSNWLGTLQLNGTNIELQIDAIPEPSTALYLGIGMGAFLLMRGRGRKAS